MKHQAVVCFFLWFGFRGVEAAAEVRMPQIFSDTWSSNGTCLSGYGGGPIRVNASR